MEYLQNLWTVLSELSFWLLFGCFISGLIHTLIPRDWFRRHLGKKNFTSILKAVLVGVPMPLCSCGVIPAAMTLKKQGASDGASIGFLISTPQTGLDSIFVTASLLSWPFAIFKLIVAFILGLIGGALSPKTSPRNVCQEIEPDQPSHPSIKKRLLLTYDFAVNDLLYNIWRWIVVGVLLSAAISTWLPADLVKNWTSHSLLLTLLAVLLVSLPLYVCATSSVPVAAALVDVGMPLSAALVFLMAGPATNLATIGAVYKGFGFRNLLNYLSTIIVGSFTLAYCFDFLLVATGAKHDHQHHSVSYAVYPLLFFFIIFLLRDIKSFLNQHKRTGPQQNLQTYTFAVSGLSCQACVNKLRTGLLSLGEVENIHIDLNSGRVSLKTQPSSQQKIVTIVHKASFQFKDFID